MTRDQVIWVFRMVLGRDPENEDVINDQIRGFSERIDLILAALNSHEYRDKHPDEAPFARGPVDARLPDH